MSSKIAQAPTEDSSLSTALAEDLPPNTHFEPATAPTSYTYGTVERPDRSSIPVVCEVVKVLISIIDSVPSTVNPDIASNHTSPDLSKTSDFTAQDSSVAESTAEKVSPLEPPSDPQTKLTEGAPNVPIRSSSNAKVESVGNPSMLEKKSADPISASRRGSKGSNVGKSRSGSVVSSKHSKKEKVESAGAVSQEKDVEDPSSNSAKTKKRGGFLSFLNCCQPPENANTVELRDQAEPAKKAKVLQQQKPGRQPTPVAKPNISVGESTTGESKDATEEGIGGPEYSEMKAASKPKMATKQSKDRVTTEKVGPPGPAMEPTEVVESSAPAVYRDPPLPPVPMVNTAPQQDAKDVLGAPTQAAGTEAPPQLIEPDQSVAEQGTAINDRTPEQEQKDSDIAMVDAPPMTTTSEEPPSMSRESHPTQINLPPPPPRTGNGGTSTASSAVTPTEKQQWLLPPLQPTLKGRKCLVLDLDETLVHSSFKVSVILFRDMPR